MATISVYKFRGIEDLYADAKGNFFWQGRPARKVYNNGSIAIMCGRSKRGIISLRKRAYKASVTVDELPF